MTFVRIDLDEMEQTSRTLQAVAASVGSIAAEVRAECAACALPPASAAEVMATVAAVDGRLRTAQIELLLQATILAQRGLLAAYDSLSVAARSSMTSSVGAVSPTTATPTGESREMSWTEFKNVNANFGTKVAVNDNASSGDWATRNGQALAGIRQLGRTSSMAQANAEFRSGSDNDYSGRVGYLKLDSPS
jgi:hypothetical protein